MCGSIYTPWEGAVKDLFSVKGKVVIVTGGSRGIGEMIAAGFLANGAKVYISSRKADVCDATAQRLGASASSERPFPLHLCLLPLIVAPQAAGTRRLSAARWACRGRRLAAVAGTQ